VELYSIDDARRIARKKLPRMIFDFIDGATGSETACRLNREALEAIRLQPRTLINVESRHPRTRFLERDWDLPFGIAPMGMCNLARPAADLAMARAASTYNIPLCLSTASSTSIEEMAKAAGDNLWFQLYVGQSEELAMSFVNRAANAGCKVLLLTVDVPQVAPRPRDQKNGFKTPIKIGPKQFIDFALHPRWSIGTLLKGIPRTANFAADAGHGAFVRNESRGKVDHDFLQRLRDRWQGKLVVKGVLSAEAAAAIQAAGADAIYVSNHGGRQLDSAPPAIEMLPRIRAAVGETFPLLFDSGVRNGESIVKAIARGANFIMLGRPFMYGLGADGELGLNRVIEILRDEMNLAMAQIGALNVEQITQVILCEERR
jgi:L-lactate dehydrogenase (cytochrome)